MVDVVEEKRWGRRGLFILALVGGGPVRRLRGVRKAGGAKGPSNVCWTAVARG